MIDIMHTIGDFSDSVFKPPLFDHLPFNEYLFLRGEAIGFIQDLLQTRPKLIRLMVAAFAEDLKVFELLLK